MAYHTLNNSWKYTDYNIIHSFKSYKLCLVL